MYTEKDIKDLVMKILNDKEDDTKTTSSANATHVVKDLSQMTGIEELSVVNPVDKDMLVKLRESTPARIGVGRAGSRYKTQTILKFKSDHAVSMDAVFNQVSQEFLDDLGLKTVQTMCTDKDEYLTRPDLGKLFDEENQKLIKEIVKPNSQVVIYASDGLSSTAIEENVKDTLPAIIAGLKLEKIDVAEPFFVEYGRVPSMDSIAELTNADVVCVLIGERPGLVTAGSMSAYMAYRPTVNMPEARRTVISNIHNSGMPSSEAGAHIVDIIKKMLETKSSGLELKL